MDEQSMMNQDQAFTAGRTAYMSQDNAGINTLLSELTDVEPILEDVKMQLLGQSYDNEGNPIKSSDPLCNKEGAYNILRMMRPMVSKVMLMSNLEEDQIRIMTEELGYDVVEDLTFNKVRYEIKHPKAITTIANLVVMIALEAGFSAKDNGTRKMLRGTTMETTINTQGQQMKTGKGGLGSILGLGRK